MNKSTVKKIVSILIMSAVIGFQISAEEEKSITTGICRFLYDDEQNSSIANGVGAAFYETAGLIGEHRLTPEEVEAFLTRQKDKDLKNRIAELEGLYSARDLIILSPSESDYINSLRKKTLEIENKKDEILKTENEIKGISESIDHDSFKVLPLDLIQPDDGRFFRKEAGTIEKTAEKNGIDLLIYGSIEKIENYSFIEVRLWNNLLERDSVVWRTAVSSEEVNNLIKEGIIKIKTGLLGRDWAELTIFGPDNSLIYIDGVFSGIGSINALIKEPGIVEVEVKKHGYSTKKQTVVLESNTETALDFQLEQEKHKTVVIQTFPAGADVYLDSVWEGKSPVRFESGNETLAVRIKKDGFAEKNFFINETSDNVLNINLKAESEGRKQWVPDARKRFYSGFGSFVLSIPFTALFYSMVEQTGIAYQQEYKVNNLTNYDELLRLQNLNMAQYSLYIASLGLNIFLFLDTIIHAVEYVDGVEYFSF